MATEALARREAVETTADEQKHVDNVLIHVRYQPNGEVFSIDDTPKGVSSAAWLKALLDKASPHYQVFAGGRGFFRIPRSTYDSILKGLAG